MARSRKELVSSPQGMLVNLAWWKDLTENEQITIQNEGAKIAQTLLHFGQAKLRIGEHLSRVHEILEPKRLFTQFVKIFHFSERTAYRYMKGYENSRTVLPTPVVEIAMSRGLNLLGDTAEKPLGVYTETVKALPPPKSPTPAQAIKWVESIEQAQKSARTKRGRSTKSTDGSDSLTKCFMFVAKRYTKLPADKFTRKQWIQRLVGMLKNIEHAIQPQAQPKRRGRPPKVQTAA